MSDKITEKKSASAAKLPEHGPIDENGREVLLSLRNVDLTFGKVDKDYKTENENCHQDEAEQ